MERYLDNLDSPVSPKKKLLKTKYVAAALGVLAIGGVGAAYNSSKTNTAQQDEIDELKAQVEDLTARLEALERRQRRGEAPRVHFDDDAPRSPPAAQHYDDVRDVARAPRAVNEKSEQELYDEIDALL